MIDIIYRKSAVKALKELQENLVAAGEPFFAGIINHAIRAIEKVESPADVVEVVRCKNCKHWNEETGWCNLHSHFIDSKGEACHPWESSEWTMFNDNDFCSDGERK